MIARPPYTKVKFSNFHRVATNKIGACIHHTVGPNCVSGDGTPNIEGDLATWEAASFALGTCDIVDMDGTIYSVFDHAYWANHLGIPTAVFQAAGLPNINRRLQREVLGLELDILGPVTLRPDGKGYWSALPGYQKSAWGREVRLPRDQVVYYPDGWHGYKYWQKYTPAAIRSAEALLMYWAHVYNFSLAYNEDMWAVSKRALRGQGGVWTHVSYRPDKSDCHPQPELIEMLKGLESKYLAITSPPIPPPRVADIPVVFTPDELSRQTANKKLKAFVEASSGIILPK